MSRLRSAALTLVALAAVTTLTGCGALHPGVAITAGEEQVTLSRVDEMTRDFCAVIQKASQEKQTYSYADLKRSVVSALAMRLSARQVADERGIDPEGASYIEARKGYELNLAALPEGERNSAIEVLTTQEYVTDILVAIGLQEYIAEGTYGTPDDQAAMRGQGVLGAWMLEHDVEIDPRFDMGISDLGVIAAPSVTSYAASDFAQLAALDPPSKEYVAALPPSQRCG